MALQAALRLLAENGPQGLSARKIAREIGYTVGTLYLVFKNQNDLIMQVNQRTLKAMRDAILAATREDQSPLVQLKSIASAYIDFACRHEHQWRLIYEHPVQEQSAMPDEYMLLSKSLFTHIEDILERATTSNSDNIPMHARALWGGVHGICILSLANKLDQSREYSLNTLTDLLIERFVSGQQA